MKTNRKLLKKEIGTTHQVRKKIWRWSQTLVLCWIAMGATLVEAQPFASVANRDSNTVSVTTTSTNAVVVAETDKSQNVHGRVLVVDDDPDIRIILQEFLTKRGYAVRTAADGQAAVALLHAEPFDVLLQDLQMPDMTGVEVAEAVREKHPDIPLALITGSSHMLSGQDLKRVGIQRVFAKPFNLSEIVEWLASLSP